MSQEEEKTEKTNPDIEIEGTDTEEEIAEEVTEEQSTITEENNEKTEEEDYLLMAKKIQAEFENYKKRNAEVIKTSTQDGVIKAVREFLPVLDSFYNAEKQATNTEFLESNKAIIKQLNKALENLGVTKIEALNQKFNHNYHNAIMIDNKEDVEANIITEVFQEGYKLGDRVIRYSVVKINQK